jgi:hypothetical protein
LLGFWWWLSPLTPPPLNLKPTPSNHNHLLAFQASFKNPKLSLLKKFFPFHYQKPQNAIMFHHFPFLIGHL